MQRNEDEGKVTGESQGAGEGGRERNSGDSAGDATTTNNTRCFAFLPHSLSSFVRLPNEAQHCRRRVSAFSRLRRDIHGLSCRFKIWLWSRPTDAAALDGFAGVIVHENLDNEATDERLKLNTKAQKVRDSSCVLTGHVLFAILVLTDALSLQPPSSCSASSAGTSTRFQSQNCSHCGPYPVSACACSNW